MAQLAPHSHLTVVLVPTALLNRQATPGEPLVTGTLLEGEPLPLGDFIRMADSRTWIAEIVF